MSFTIGDLFLKITDIVKTMMLYHDYMKHEKS